MQAFFGVDPANYDLALLLDWERYVHAWPKLDGSLKELGIGQFWKSPTVQALFPPASNLVRVALWYANMPTSNVGTERVFGVLRGMEDDLRRRASEGLVTTELLATANKWLVDGLMAKHKLPTRF